VRGAATAQSRATSLFVSWWQDALAELPPSGKAGVGGFLGFNVFGGASQPVT